MRVLRTYQPPGHVAPLWAFVASLEPKLQRKLQRQFHMLAFAEISDLKEPHYKHFILEKYSQFYELREKNKILVRIIFVISDEDVFLLTPFIKRQPRDTMRALDASLRMLAEIREHPDYAVNMNLVEEETK